MVRVRQMLVRPMMVACVMLACQVGAQPGDEDWTFNVDEAANIVEGGHCVAHEFNVPGQGVHLSGSGVHLSGSVGGMVLGPIVYEDSEDPSASAALTPTDVRTVVMDTTGPAESAFLDQELTRDVLIIVADDFAKGNYTVPRDVFTLTNDETSRDMLRTMVETGEFSHGALVMHHLNELIAATGRFDLVKDQLTYRRDNADITIPVYFWQWVVGSEPRTVIVAPLDMSDLAGDPATVEAIDVAGVVNALNSYLGQLFGAVASAHNQALDDVVVNFSWVFLPCASIQEFLDDPREFDSYDEYLEWIELLDETVDFGQLMRFLGDVDDQYLVDIFQEGGSVEGSAQRTMFVAAAGNFSREYQMLPAGWSHVVGASVAEVPARELPGRYANFGDVTVAGEWISLQELSENGGMTQATQLSYAGTSFAAPLVTLYSALDLVGEERCSGYDSSNPAMREEPRLTIGSMPKDAFSDPGDVWLPTAIDDCQ